MSDWERDFRRRNRPGLLEWVAKGKILGVDDDDRAIPWPIVYHLEEFNENAKVAHLAYSLKLFPSVAEAKRNGYDKLLIAGNYRFGKRFGHTVVVDSVDDPYEGLGFTIGYSEEMRIEYHFTQFGFSYDEFRKKAFARIAA